MTKSGKRLAGALGALATAVFLAAGLPASSQEPGPPPGGPRPRGDRPDLDRVLAMTPEQKSAYDALQKERRESARPLMDEQRRLGEQLREALEAANPDPATVGQRAIALQAARKRLKALDERFHQRLLDMLDPPQREKLGLLDQMRERAPGPPLPPPE